MSWSLRLRDESWHEQATDGLLHPTVGARFKEGIWLDRLLEGLTDSEYGALTQAAPIRVGDAEVTKSKNLNFKNVVHAPVRTGPGTPTTEENLQVGLRTALVSADEEGLGSLTIPRWEPPDGLSEEDREDVVKTLIQDLAHYPANNLSEIIVASTDYQWLEWIRQHFPDE